jgi:hypothetical protein
MDDFSGWVTVILLSVIGGVILGTALGFLLHVFSQAFRRGEKTTILIPKMLRSSAPDSRPLGRHAHHSRR